MSEPLIEPIPLREVGRFRLIKKIGFGGFADVYEAERDGRRYALKLFRNDLADTIDAERYRPSHLAATGPLAGSGTARFADSGGKTDHVTIALHGGTITLSAVETGSTFKPDFHACTLSATGHGTFTITGGTGAYGSATGTGTYIRYSTIIGRHAATGACLGKNSPPQASFDTIVMTGNANRG